MQGDVAHGYGSSGRKIVCTSSRVGKRQSQCPAKQAPPFRLARKFVKADPSAGFPGVSHTLLLSTSVHHSYWLSASCGSARFCVSSKFCFFSHCRPVRLSRTVPSPLSAKRG